MKSFKIEQAKSKQNEIRKNIEQKENRLRELDESKEKLMEAGMEIQASDIDEEIKNTIMDRINSGLKEISEKGKEETEEMDGNLKELEEIKSETEESLESNLSESEKLAAKKEFLDKLGLGRTLDNAVNDLQSNQQDLESLKESLLEDEKKLMDIAHQLENL